MLELIGRFHPLLVHLPIGILLLAILFELLPSGMGFKNLKRSIYVILWLGALTAVLSCITGYFLSQGGDYASELVKWHQWMGISTAIYSFGYAWMRKRSGYKSYRKTFAVILLILITVTGHLGGSLTHGEGYLTGSLTAEKTVDLSDVNLQEAKFYEDLVMPILEARCYSCHGSSKQKGKLRLDGPEHILKGGEDGKIVIAGKVSESDMISRMMLPRDNEDHMPPKEKPQPSAKEIEILKAWVAAGADFEKSVTETNQLEVVQKILSSESHQMNKAADVPEESVAAAKPEVVNELIKLGVVIIPVANGSNYLSANLINVSDLDNAITQLAQLKEQLVWLKGGSQPITDTQVEQLVQLTNLTRLSLDHSAITDLALDKLKSLNKLQYLNLNGTQITADGLSILKDLPELVSIYVYQTQIKPEEIVLLQKSFKATIDQGNYTVPFLTSDTTVATAPKQ